MSKILVVGDAHAKPDVSNERFDALGNFAVDQRPDLIVLMGDVWDMASLCMHDIDTVAAWDRFYKEDIEAGNDAINRVTRKIKREVDRIACNKKRKWEPKLVCLMGNHEQRISKYVSSNPHLKDTLTMDDFYLDDWQVVPFLQPYVHWAGKRPIAFQHYFTSGVMGRPIGSMTPAKANVTKSFVSCVFGHSHMRDYWETTDAIGRSLFGLEAGCFFGHEEHYTTESDRWWRGLVVLNDVDEFGQNPSFYGYESVLSKFL